MSNRILIVDESEHYANMLITRLRNYGYDEISTAVNGTDGLNKVEAVRPDVVVIDTRLSDMDSFRLCRQIKESFGGTIKVVMMVALSEQYNAEKAKVSQADAYVVKTYDCLLLMAAIKKALFLSCSENFTDSRLVKEAETIVQKEK